MPVAGQRDPAEVKLVLEEWMGRQMPEASGVEITDLVVPQSSGFSNETFLLDARWDEADGAKVESRLVLRSQPALHHLFPEIDIIAQQYTVMRQLGLHTDVPVPPHPVGRERPVGAGRPVLRDGPPRRAWCPATPRPTPRRASSSTWTRPPATSGTATPSRP